MINTQDLHVHSASVLNFCCCVVAFSSENDQVVTTDSAPKHCNSSSVTAVLSMAAFDCKSRPPSNLLASMREKSGA